MLCDAVLDLRSRLLSRLWSLLAGASCCNGHQQCVMGLAWPHGGLHQLGTAAAAAAVRCTVQLLT